MKCLFSKEFLALYVEGDLSDSQAQRAKLHLLECPECEQFFHHLQQHQSLLKSLRHRTVSPAVLNGVRQAVLSRIDDAQETPGWAVRLERFLLLGIRRPRYVAASLGVLAIVSVSLLGQMQHTPSDGNTAAVSTAAVFEGKDTLVRPEGYREWVFVGSSLGLNYSQHAAAPENRSELFHNVYIDRPAYRRYAETGEFPEGTVMVLETASSEARKEAGLQRSYEGEFVALEASVKDSSRFEGGWGYFGFTDPGGNLKAKALPEESSCRSCHQKRAETDHVFTQFYPILRAVGAKS